MPIDACSLDYRKKPTQHLYTDSKQSKVYKFDETRLIKDFHGIGGVKNTTTLHEANTFATAYNRLHGNGKAHVIVRPQRNSKDNSYQYNPDGNTDFTVSVIYHNEGGYSKSNTTLKALEEYEINTHKMRDEMYIKFNSDQTLEESLQYYKDKGVYVENIDSSNVIFNPRTERIELMGLDTAIMKNEGEALTNQEVSNMRGKLLPLIKDNKIKTKLNNYAFDKENKVASMGRRRVIGEGSPTDRVKKLENAENMASQLQEEGVTTVIILDDAIYKDTPLNAEFTKKLESKGIEVINDPDSHIPDAYSIKEHRDLPVKDQAGRPQTDQVGNTIVQNVEADLTPEKLHQHVMRVDQVMKKPHAKVVIVCAAGNGRSATVKAAYAIWKKSQNGDPLVLNTTTSRTVNAPVGGGGMSGDRFTKPIENEDWELIPYPIVSETIHKGRSQSPTIIERPEDVRILNEYTEYLKKQRQAQSLSR